MVTKMNIIKNGKSLSFEAVEDPNGSFVLASDYEALKADRDAQQKRADALAVENAEMRGAIDAAIVVAHQSSGIAGWHLNDDIAGWDEIFPELNIETPATDAALAAIEARGVEKLIKLKMEQLASMHPDTYAFGATAESLRAQINELQAFAAELREAK